MSINRILQLHDGTRFEGIDGGIGTTGARIFLIYNSDVATVAGAFGDSSKTYEIIINPDSEYRLSIIGYTSLVYINLEQDKIRVALKKESV